MKLSLGAAFSFVLTFVIESDQRLIAEQKFVFLTRDLL